jgi:hypothetical protein
MSQVWVAGGAVGPAEPGHARQVITEAQDTEDPRH